MALRDLLKAPLDQTRPDAQHFMERVQGNIIKGTGAIMQRISSSNSEPMSLAPAPGSRVPCSAG